MAVDSPTKLQSQLLRTGKDSTGPHLTTRAYVDRLVPPTTLTPTLISSMSSVHEPAQPKNAPSQAVEWPFEHFPSLPPDGNLIPKFSPPRPSKFAPPLPSVPSDLTLDPPVMDFTYPPPPPLSNDPTWLNQMVTDLKRQRSHLEMCLSEAHKDVVNAYAEAGLADAELEEERALMQAFLDVVASVAGKGFVKRMLGDVDASVAVMSGLKWDDGESGDEDGSSSSSASHP